jgi:hypothetical protein
MTIMQSMLWSPNAKGRFDGEVIVQEARFAAGGKIAVVEVDPFAGPLSLDQPNALRPRLERPPQPAEGRSPAVQTKLAV